MKPLVSTSFCLFIVIIACLQTSISSCTKEETIYKTDTVTVVRKDTVVIQDTAISLELLTANSWKVQELRGVTGNNLVLYLRGGSSNTENYDNEYITFNASKTGIYFDNNGFTHQITWDFLNSTNTKLTFTVSNPAPLAPQTVVYENLRYKNGSLLFDQYWMYNNVNHHAQSIRIKR